MTQPLETPPSTAQLRVGPASKPLEEALQERVVRTVVDSRSGVPTMIEVTFRDVFGDVLEQAGLTHGTPVEVWAQGRADAPAQLLASAEITSLEGDYRGLALHTVIRGYDTSHRLQRARRSRTFVNMTDSDVARQLAQAAGLRISRIESTRTSHAHLAQTNQTDWDFLTWRANENGFEFGVSEDGFFFGSASHAGQPIPLVLQRNLRAFRPRVSSANLAPEVEVRVWNPLEAKAVASKTTLATAVAKLEDTPVNLARAAGARGSASPATPPAGSQSLGPAPSANGHVVTGRPSAVGAAIGAASRELLDGAVNALSSRFALADAEVFGDPELLAGKTVRVEGAPGPFAGIWSVAAARHVFDVHEAGYRTRLQLGDAADRSLVELTSSPGRSAPRIDGLVCAVVTDVNDPAGCGRIKAVVPLFSPDHETDWAPVVQPAGGRRAGALMLPEVGDQVLIGFELGDPRRPYVVGGVLTTSSAYTLGGPAVQASGKTAEVIRRGIVSPAGNMLSFLDKLPPGRGQSPTESSVVLGTGDGALGIAINQVAGTVTLTCKPKPPSSKSSKGQITIDCGDGGTIAVKAGVGGNVEIDGGSALQLRAQSSIKIESSGVVAIKGSKIELN
ncbi:VgrG-related protein [Streptomyces chartreusis]